MSFRPIIEVDDAKLARSDEETQRFGCLNRLLEQLEILEIRIRDAIAGRSVRAIPERHIVLMDVLHLDTETYYTVAADALNTIERLMPETRAKTFGKDRTVKTFRRLRNNLVRHALDKDDGDPYAGFRIESGVGVILKGGGPGKVGRNGKVFRDPGFVPNLKALMELFEKYGVRRSGRFELYQQCPELRPWTALAATAAKKGN